MHTVTDWSDVWVGRGVLVLGYIWTFGGTNVSLMHVVLPHLCRMRMMMMMKRRTIKRTNLRAAVPALRTHQVPDRTLTEPRRLASTLETWEQHLSWAMSCTGRLSVPVLHSSNHQGVLSLCATSTHQCSTPLLFICCIIFLALLSTLLKPFGKIFWADDTDQLPLQLLNFPLACQVVWQC